MTIYGIICHTDTCSVKCLFFFVCQHNIQQNKMPDVPWEPGLACLSQSVHALSVCSTLIMPTALQSGFVQKLKCFFQDFPGLAKTKFQGFPGLKNPFFPGLSRTRSIHKHGLHKVKKVHIQQNQLSVYLHYSKELKMQYPMFYYFI